MKVAHRWFVGSLAAAFFVAPAWSQEPASPVKQRAKAPAERASAGKASAEVADGKDWVRLAFDSAGKPSAMETAITRYEGVYPPTGKPIAVDLVAAVHVGDAAYYAQLNERFQRYDALLYELVAPEGTVIQPGAKASSRNPLGALQAGMKNTLELEHQLEKIDYTRRNFVHADMSPEQFFKSMEDRDEGIVSMYLRMTGRAIAMQSSGEAGPGGGDLEILFALFAKDRARRLKIAMARQLAQSESLLSGFGGEEGSTLITERNKTALDVLKRELAAGRQSLGIFYGAGHLADMDERLRRDFGLQPTRVDWLEAWNLRPADAK